MIELVCEHCGDIFLRDETRRFCSARCRYHRLASLGIRPIHNKPHSEEAKTKIRVARAKQDKVWNKGIKTGLIPWNKGLCAETDSRMAEISKKLAVVRRGKKRGPLSSDTKRKLGEGRRGAKNWVKRPEVREKIRQSVIRMYREHPEILENRKRCGRNQFSGEMSSLEEIIATVMDALGVPYIHNARAGRFWADFIIFDRVIVECDGAYWHQDEEKERRRDQYLHEKGFFVFHLKEEDILKDPVECVRRLIRLYVPFAELSLTG